MGSDTVNDHDFDRGALRSRGHSDVALAVLGLQGDQDALERGPLYFAGAGVDLRIALNLRQNGTSNPSPKPAPVKEFRGLPNFAKATNLAP